MALSPTDAWADILNDVTLKTDSNGEIDAYVNFVVPVRYIRYAPQRRSPYLVVYFDILNSVPIDEWQNYETHRSPPSNLVVGFTVTTRNLNVGPMIEVQFKHSVEVSSVREGEDGRSIIIHIKPNARQRPQSRAAPLHPHAGTSPARLGIDTPPFPALEIPTGNHTKHNTAEASPSLKDKLKIIDGQAAALMRVARDALAAGKTFEAVDALNKVLNLPANKYSPAAQLWIGIARERGGQIEKAKIEFELYLKLYPRGAHTSWVRRRLALLARIQPQRPAPKNANTTSRVAATPTPKSEPLHWSEYGSLSTYYYRGTSQTNTVVTVGTLRIPTTFSVLDQSSAITNVMLTARSYNNKYDNRIVFQDFYSNNFLNTPGSTSTNRLNALYGEWKDRIDNAYLRVGRQSALGGGVMGRFDGGSAGYGLSSNWRANIAAGRLSDATLGPKPVFYSASLDYGLTEPVGGQIYTINQTVGGVLDRRAVGGTLRYFDPVKTALAMFDYDTQFRQWDMVTLQGTFNAGTAATYNFLIDSRRSPILSIRNAVNGTVATLNELLLNGWTQTDLIALAKSRDAVANTAQIGLTYRISETLQSGTDIIVSNTTSIPASGTLNPDGTTGLEGFVAAIPGSGNNWTISQRLIASDLFTQHEVSTASISLNKSTLLSGKMLMLTDHATLHDAWIIDPALRFYWQTDSTGGKETVVSPSLRCGFQMKNSLTLDAEVGYELTNVTPATMPPSRIQRKYFALGFRWNF